MFLYKIQTLKENFSSCTSAGLQCYLDTRVGEDKCGMPCSGIYADIDHVEDDQTLLENEEIAKLKETYESYKRGRNNDVKYPNELAGKSAMKVKLPIQKHGLGFQQKSTLHCVKIYFSTPTFEKITYDLKANFMTRISTIGKNPLK